jgi:protein-cysteine N-palmitoyltransferase HHAT
LSDHQFRSFREGIPSLAALYTFSILINRSFGNTGRLIGTIGFIFLLHGFKALEPICLISLNFLLLKYVSKKLITPFTWIYAISSLFLLESRSSYDFWIWSGFLSRWNIVFKISILRMISFNLDYKKSSQEILNVDCCQSNEQCHKCRVADDFSFKSFFMYIFYPPLYLSGPILTFNDFNHQISHKNYKNRIPFPYIYGLRLLTSMFTLELILHLFHVCAIKSASAWHSSFTPLAFAGIAFFNLKIIWLKLLIIWRFSRFFSLCDGIDPPENMIRCMSNNYSTLKFWRSWHRSFNLWILKYLYIPLGGRETSNWNIFPIFVFVAIWHDVNWQLLAWGCLVPLIILPEILANFVSKRFRLYELKNYRAVCAMAAALNIFLMMLCNLVGFSVGLEGAKLMLNQVVGNGGFWFVGSVLVVFYSGAQLMFEIREEEFRKTGKYSSM